MDERSNDNVNVDQAEVEVKENELKLAEVMKDKKRTKEDKIKRRDDKRLEQFLKSLGDFSNVEDRLDMMCKKYFEIVDENRKLQLGLKQSEKKLILLQREREQFQNERSKAALTRRRLENLCRELQKQNKAVKEESLVKIREQEEMRKELSEKFQAGLAQITTLMNQNIEKNAKMYEENVEMNKKFKSVYEQVELKEQQLLKVHQQMKLDLQIADAKLAKVKIEATAEKEVLLKEKQQLLLKLAEYQAQIRELQTTEVNLRSQISIYTDKYDEFQNALTKSNKVYGEFNVEMEKMSKKILALEKETGLWKQRWESSHAALLDMAADKQLRDTEMATLHKKLTLLQDLCKMFQCERTNLLAQLKEKNTAPPEPKVISEDVNCMRDEANELSKLEKTFGQLQASLTQVSDVIQENLDHDEQSDITKITHDSATTDQKPQNCELDEKTVDSPITTELLDIVDTREEDILLTEKEVTKIDYETETQHVKGVTDSFDASLLSMKSSITDEELLESALELKESEDLDKNPYEIIKQLNIKVLREKTNEITESSKDANTSNEVNVTTEQTRTEIQEIDDLNTNLSSSLEETKITPNIEFASSETENEYFSVDVHLEMEKQNEVLAQKCELTKLESENMVDTANESTEKIVNTFDYSQPVHEKINGSIDAKIKSNCNETDPNKTKTEHVIGTTATDLIKKLEIDLLQHNVNGHRNAEFESQTVENNHNNKMYENIKSEKVEENLNLDVANTYSRIIHCPSPINTACNENVIISDNEISPIENTPEMASEVINTLVENNSEVSHTSNIDTQNAILISENKPELSVESTNTIVPNDSIILADNTIQARISEDLLSLVESISGTISMPETTDATSMKKGPVKPVTIIKGNYLEEKTRQPGPTKCGRRRKK